MFVVFFFFNDTATTEIYTLSLHDALPIWLSVPTRLCSTSCRGLESPSTPARMLGFAAASITQSLAGRASMSLAARASPCTSLTPRRFRSARFPSLPGRMKLSKPEISYPGPCAASARAIALPAKPQIPEMSMRTPVLPLVGRLCGWLGGGLLPRLLVGLALMDAYLEKVAHEHPGLPLLRDGVRGGRRGGGRDRAGERRLNKRRGLRTDGCRGPGHRGRARRCERGLAQRQLLECPPDVHDGLVVGGVKADDMDAIADPADGDPLAALGLALVDAHRDVGSLHARA